MKSEEAKKMGAQMTTTWPSGHSEGEGAGGGCAPSRAEREAKILVLFGSDLIYNVLAMDSILAVLFD